MKQEFTRRYEKLEKIAKFVAEMNPYDDEFWLCFDCSAKMKLNRPVKHQEDCIFVLARQLYAPEELGE